MGNHLGPAGTPPPEVQPACPIHGQMVYVEACCWWACKGWDGEGCPYRVGDEMIARDGTHGGLWIGPS